MRTSRRCLSSGRDPECRRAPRRREGRRSRCRSLVRPAFQASSRLNWMLLWSEPADLGRNVARPSIVTVSWQRAGSKLKGPLIPRLKDTWYLASRGALNTCRGVSASAYRRGDGPPPGGPASPVLVLRAPGTLAAGPKSRKSRPVAVDDRGDPGALGDDSRDDRVGRLEVFLQEERREREHVADVVEAVPVSSGGNSASLG